MLMEHYVSYCKSCRSLAPEAHNRADEAGICPKCGAVMSPTGLTPKEWNRKSQEELTQIRSILETTDGSGAEIVNQVRQSIAAYHFEQVQNVLVTTGDLKEEYEILGPVCVQVTNKGAFNNSYSLLLKKHMPSLAYLHSKGQLSSPAGWGILTGSWSADDADFSKAFFICTQELKERTLLLGGEAVICMRQDTAVDTDTFHYFYLDMYGTAVKRKKA